MAGGAAAAGMGPTLSGGTGGAPTRGSGGGSAGLAGAGSGGSEGAPPVCVAPAIGCGSNCVDVATDAANCGACGYACGAGSTCAQGACAPVAVVSGVVAPYAFALDATNLYFASPVVHLVGNAAQPLLKAPRGGGAAAILELPGQLTFRSRTLAIAGSTLYFGNLASPGALLRAPAAGGDVTTHAASQGAIYFLVTQGAHVWWSTFTGDTARVRRATLDGTPVVEELASATPQFGQVPSLVAEGEGAQAVAYWVNRGGSSNLDNGLWRRTFEDGVTDPESLVEGGAMLQLGLGGGAIFVADAAQGIGRAEKTGSNQIPVAVVAAGALGGSLQGFTVAGEALYWLAFNAGQLEVHRSGLDGSGARVLGRVAAKLPTYWNSPIGPSQLVVDGGFVYFSDPGTIEGDTQAASNLQGVTGAADGAIYRLPQ
jgi:hypothetical protein